MKNYKIILSFGILSGLFFGLLVFTPVAVQAVVGDVQLDNPLTTTTIPYILGSVTKKLLTILGSITLLVFVVGGFLWLTSAGNAEKVKLGTNTMLYAIIGLFIIFASYAILNTVIGGLTGEKIASQSGNNNTTQSAEDKDALCKASHPDWSCNNINNCEGVVLKTNAGKKDWIEACTDKKNCENNLCLGQLDDIKCCKPKASPVANTGTVNERDVECKKVNPAWSCMDVDECNLNLTGKKTTTQKRTVCNATKASCTTGKCNVGADADNLEIVCCESKGEKGCKQLGGFWDNTNKKCEICLNDSDCEEGKVCQKQNSASDDAYNDCVDKNLACSNDEDCAEEGKVCGDFGSLKGKCVGCDSNSDCEGGGDDLGCIGETGECGIACQPIENKDLEDFCLDESINKEEWKEDFCGNCLDGNNRCTIANPNLSLSAACQTLPKDACMNAECYWVAL